MRAEACIQLGLLVGTVHGNHKDVLLAGELVRRDDVEGW